MLVVPSTVITVHMTLNAAVVEILVCCIKEIQRYLQSQLDEENNLYDGVIQRLSRPNKNKIDDLVHVFKIYYEISKTVQTYNEFFGLQYAIYAVLSECLHISEFYYIYIGKIKYFLNPDEPLPYNSIVGYWMFVYGSAIILLAFVSQRLKDASVVTASTLHKFIDKQQHLRDEVNKRQSNDFFLIIKLI